MSNPSPLPPFGFVPFPKTPRLNREVIITEKIDGSNAQILIVPRYQDAGPTDATCAVAQQGDYLMFAGSRTRWITPGKTTDNYGFADWVCHNAPELFKLGPGRHFGEWWGRGINRGYGLNDRRFSLFNAGRWFPSGESTPEGFQPGVFEEPLVDGLLSPREGPNCCHVVPTIWRGNFDTFDPIALTEMLRVHGSFAAPGYRNPEGIIIYHTAAGHGFKVLLEGDEHPKGLDKS